MRWLDQFARQQREHHRVDAVAIGMAELGAHHALAVEARLNAMPVLLLDLDNTLADREAAFLTWAHSKVEKWAPNDSDAVTYLIEQDDDGLRPRHEFFRGAPAL